MSQIATKSPNGHVKPEIGAPGLSQWGGWIDSEWDKRLRSKRDRNDAINRMVDDATIAAARTAIDSLCCSVATRVSPGIVPDDDAVQFIESALYEMDDDFNATLTEILTFIDWGFSLFEITYVVRDGKNGRSADNRVGWQRWATRAQDTIESWKFDEGGRDATHAVQRFPNSGTVVKIPLDQCLHFKTKNRRQSPEGKSLIRAAYDPWYHKFNIQRIESIGIERDMTGVPVIKIPGDDMTKPDKLAGYEAMVRNIRRDEHTGLILPSDRDESGNPKYEFTLVSTAGQHQTDTDAVIARYERMILRVLLSDWMALGDAGGGSFALGVSKQEAFAAFAQGLLSNIADTITNQAIRPLCEANRIPDDHAPKFGFETISKRDMAKFAQSVSLLIAAVDMKDPGVRGVIYDELGLPQPDDGFDAEPPPDVTAQIDAALAGLKAQQAAPQLGPGEQQREPISQSTAAQFTENVTPDLYERARAAFRQSVPEELAGLLDAKVVEE